MPTVTVYPSAPEPSHDISLSDDAETFGLIYSQGPQFLQEIPISDPARPFTVNQKSWYGGKGRLRYQDDPNGYFDSQSMWTMTDGKLFPVPQWKFAQGIRSCDSSLPGSVSWQPLLGTQLYISRTFTASASYSADKAYLWVKRSGNPGTLTLKLHSDTAGSPGTVLATVTKAYTDLGAAGDSNPPSAFVVFDWSSTVSLTASTVYHISVYGATTDNNGNHWEVGVGSGSSSKYSSAGSSWTTAAFSMYYRVTDVDISRQWFPFTLEAAQYMVSKNDDALVASKIFINGDRFKCTAATSNALTDSSSGVSTGWTTDRFAGARVRIIDGTGDGQDKLIVSNTSTVLTTDTFETVGDTTSKAVIYGTDWWTEVTGHGLGRVVSKPIAGAKIAYFPQGESVNVRRMAIDHTAAIQHQYAADGTNKADFMAVFQNQTGSQIWKARQLTCGASAAPVQTTWANLVFGSEKVVGSIDTRLTNLFVANDLYAFKEDSLYRFENSNPKKINIGLDDVIDPSNGLAVSSAPGAIWIGWNHSIARMVGSDVSDQLNFRAGYNGVPSDRAGIVTSIVTVMGWTFFAIDGGASNYSSILVWNGFGWMEIFRGWAAGVRIRNIFWQANVNCRPRLWFDVGGDLAYMEFPLRSVNPLLDTGIAFQHEATLTTGTMDANELSLYKLFHSFRVITENLGTFGKVYVDFQTNAEVGTSTWHTAGELASTTIKNFVFDLGEKYSIRFRLRIQTNAATSAPVVTSYSSDGWVSSPLKYQWVGNFKVGLGYVTKNGLDDHKPDDVVAFLRSAFEKSKKVLLRSLKSTMDDKIVILSAPVVVTDSLTDEGWKGRISIALREA